MMRDSDRNIWRVRAAGRLCAACFCVAALTAVSAARPAWRESVAPWPKLGGDARNSGTGPANHSTGAIAWSIRLSAPARGTVVVGADGTVYAACEDGAVYAVNGETGDTLWRIVLPSRVGGAPALCGGVLVVAASGGVYGLRPRDGTQEWSWTGGAQVRGDIASDLDGTVYFVTADQKLVALDARSGRRLWSAAAESLVGSLAAAGPGGTVYFADAMGLYCLRRSSGQITRRRQLRNRTPVTPSIGSDGTVFVAAGVPDSVHVEALSPRGALRWSTKPDPAYGGTSGVAVGPDTSVYVGTGGSAGGRLLALGGGTGAQRWAITETAPLSGPPVLTANGTLLYGCINGSLTALDAATGQRRWVARLGAPCFCQPAIGLNDWLYIGTQDGKLHAFQ